MLFLLIITIFIPLINALPIPTNCDTQLHTFYEGLGMSALTPLEQIFNFTTGVLLGVPFVQIGIRVQSAALSYANSFSFTPLPNNSYVSLDVPYCFSNITFSCVSRIIYGITKTSNCTLLLDRDVSFGSSIAGRLFIYPDQSAPCNGDALITIYNSTLTPAVNSSYYSYDIDGILTGVLKTQTSAVSAYRNAFCELTDGDPTEASNLTQFVCLDYALQCASPRPVNSDIISVVELSARYRCITPGTTKNFVQVINHDETLYGIESEFDLGFISTITGLPLTTVYDRQLITPQTIRQYSVLSPFTNYNISAAFGTYNKSSEALSIPPIPSQFLNRIPCICDFSVVCNGTVIDISPQGTIFYINNTIPVAISNTSTPFVRRGDFALLNNDDSYDPDMFPKNLTGYWILGQGIDDINITMINPEARNNATFQTYNYTEGVYQMVSIVSDGQDLNASFTNVSAVDIFPTCNAKPQIFGEINQTVYLNATESFDPLNASLTAFWLQLSGFSVNITNNETLLANFTALFSGTYIFILNVTNGIKNCSYQQIVIINPATFAPLNDNGTSISPTSLPPNRTLSPIDQNQTDIPFVPEPPFNFPDPNVTFTPTPLAPVPIFPPVIPPTTVESYIFWILFAVFLGISLLLLFWSCIEQDDEKQLYIIKNRYIVTSK